MQFKKKFRTIVSLLFAFVILLLIGCNDEITNTYYTSDGRVIGNVHGIVTDANTNARVNGIDVTTIINGEIITTITDSLGYYAFTNLFSGDYEISYFGKNDYAVSRTTVTIPTLQEIGITDFPTSKDFYHSEKIDIDLFMLNSGITGTVWAKYDEENTNLADGVTIVADFSNFDISPDKYITTTNSDGSFTFNNLPATGNVELLTMPYNDGTSDYSVNSKSVTLIPNVITNSNNIVLSTSQATPFIVKNNFRKNNFNLFDDIVLSFSKPMDPSSFDIMLFSSTYGNVEFKESWDNNNITLTINPYVSLQVNGTYNLTLMGKSTDNNNYSDSFVFSTTEGIQFVKTNLERIDGVFDAFSIYHNIEITFTENVDLNNKDGYVYLIDQFSEIGQTTNSLSPDSRTLIINPIDNLVLDHNYTLSYKVYSIFEQDFISGSISFKTQRN